MPPVGPTASTLTLQDRIEAAKGFLRCNSPSYLDRLGEGSPTAYQLLEVLNTFDLWINQDERDCKKLVSKIGELMRPALDFNIEIAFKAWGSHPVQAYGRPDEWTGHNGILERFLRTLELTVLIRHVREHVREWGNGYHSPVAAYLFVLLYPRLPDATTQKRYAECAVACISSFMQYQPLGLQFSIPKSVLVGCIDGICKEYSIF